MTSTDRPSADAQTLACTTHTSARPKRKSTKDSAKPHAGLYRKTEIEPAALFAAWSRREKEAVIEALIASLDATDGDPDLEDGGDAEPDTDREDDRSDDEPSLGRTVDGFAGSDDDREDGSVAPDTLVAARARYTGEAPSPRLQGPGRAVDALRLPRRRRLTGLSTPQRAALAPRLNRREVTL